MRKVKSMVIEMTVANDSDRLVSTLDIIEKKGPVISGILKTNQLKFSELKIKEVEELSKKQ